MIAFVEPQIRFRQAVDEHDEVDVAVLALLPACAGPLEADEPQTLPKSVRQLARSLVSPRPSRPCPLLPLENQAFYYPRKQPVAGGETARQKDASIRRSNLTAPDPLDKKLAEKTAARKRPRQARATPTTPASMRRPTILRRLRRRPAKPPCHIRNGALMPIFEHSFKKRRIATRKVTIGRLEHPFPHFFPRKSIAIVEIIDGQFGAFRTRFPCKIPHKLHHKRKTADWTLRRAARHRRKHPCLPRATFCATHPQSPNREFAPEEPFGPAAKTTRSCRPKDARRFPANRP